MTPGELLVIGMTAGVILCSLLNELLRWTPSSRDLLTAMPTAILIDLAINGRRDLDLAATYAGEAAGAPHVCPCVASAFIAVLAVLHVIGEE
jgi:hypothetical protein